MGLILFFGVVMLAFLLLRWLVMGNHAQRSDSSPGQDNSYPSHPTDSYANPYVPRDYDDSGCRPEPADCSDSDGGEGGGDSGGDSGSSDSGSSGSSD